MARYALVIGISNYSGSGLSKLSKAAHDAEAIATLLHQHGNFQEVKRLPARWIEAEQRYQVSESKSLSGVEMGEALRQFLLEQAQGQDGLIYFSGHGFTTSSSLGMKRGYLAASDTRLEVQQKPVSGPQIMGQLGGIALDEFNDLIRQSQLSSLVVLLDCCHGGYLIDRQLTERSLSAFRQKQDYCLITASRSFEQAWEGNNYSVFTEAVLAGLSRDNANPETGRVSGDRLFDVVYTRLQHSGQEPFRTGIGRAITLVTYPIQASCHESSANESQPPEFDESVTPYRGLEPFEAEQTPFFFGRRQVVEDIWNVLDRQGFVAVVGASGSGKSSVVRAGLIPWLTAADWQILPPMKPGITPLAALTTLFQPFVSGKQGLRRLDEWVSTHPNGLRQIANHLDSTTGPSDAGSSCRYLLVVDQFEELFTVSRPGERDRLIHLLTNLASQPHPHLAVVITMRADFVDACLRYPELTRLIQHQAIFMPPLVGADLEQAIAEPARKVGYSLETGLLGSILHDLGQETGSLPLLQFALLELWERRDRTTHQLTCAAYEDMGGVLGALNDHAEGIYGALNPLEQEWAKRLCLRLIRTGTGDRDTRQRQPKQHLLDMATDEADREALESALDALVDGRLLVSSADGNLSSSASIDLAHEALTEGWQRFSQWRDENRDLRRLVDRMEDAYREWTKHHQSDIYLLPKALTTQATLYADKLVDDLSPHLQGYLAESQAYEQRQANALEWAKSEGALIARANEALSLLDQNPVEGALQVIRLVKLNLETADPPPIGPVQNALYQAVEKGRECNRMDGHHARIMDVAFSPDGQLIASSAEDRTVRRWDLQGNPVGEPLHIVSGAGFPAIAFHPHQPIIVAGGDRSIRIWHYEADEASQRIQAHWDTVFAIAISPDGTLFASGSRDHTIKFWNLDGQQVGQAINTGTRVWALAFHPDGQKIAAGLHDHTIRLWDIDGNPIGQPFEGHREKVNSVCFSPDGSSLLSGSNDKTIRRWNLDGELLQEYTDHGDEVKAVAFSPDGTVIGSCSRDGTIRLRRLDGESVIEPLRGHTGSVRAIAFSPTQPLLISGSHDDTIRIWDWEPELIGLPLRGHENYVRSVAFSPDGQTIVSGSEDRTLRLWSRNGHAIGKPFKGHEAPIWSVAFSPDGQTIVSGSADGTIRLWSRNGHAIGEPFKGHEASVLSVAFSPVREASPEGNEQTIVSGSADHTVRLWNRNGHAIGEPFKGHEASVWSVTFSPDGQTIVSGSTDRTIRLWSRNGHAVGAPFKGHEASVLSVAFSPVREASPEGNGQTIVSGSADGTIRLWSRNGHAVSEPFRGHEFSVWSVTFSPDGQTIVSGSTDHTVRLWNRNGHAIGEPFKGHKADVLSVAFSPDGQTIVSGSADHTVRLWQVDSWRDWLMECCDRLRYHPVLNDSADVVAQEARAFCREWCGWEDG